MGKSQLIKPMGEGDYGKVSNLNEQIKVVSTGSCLCLIAIILVVISLFLWCVLANLERKVEGVVISENGSAICYVRASDFENYEDFIQSKVNLKGQNHKYNVESQSQTPVGCEKLSAYAKSLIGAVEGEYFYQFTIDESLQTGCFVIEIVVETISPIDYLLG